MTMIMTDEMIMNDDDYRNCDDHHGSASSAVKSSFSSFTRHHTSSSSATTHGNLRRFTERNTRRPVIISFSLKETRKNIIKYLKIMKKWPKLGTRSHPPSKINTQQTLATSFIDYLFKSASRKPRTSPNKFAV